MVTPTKRHVLLTLDLDAKTSSGVREDFYERLADDHYEKVPNVTTTWRLSFEGGTLIDIQRRIIREVRAHAKAAGVKAFEAVAQVGNSPAILFDAVLPVLDEPRS